MSESMTVSMETKMAREEAVAVVDMVSELLGLPPVAEQTSKTALIEQGAHLVIERYPHHAGVPLVCITIPVTKIVEGDEAKALLDLVEKSSA